MLVFLLSPDLVILDTTRNDLVVQCEGRDKDKITVFTFALIPIWTVVILGFILPSYWNAGLLTSCGPLAAPLPIFAL